MQVEKVGGANKGRGGERGEAVKEVRRETGRDREVRGGCGKDMGGEGPAQGEGCRPVGSKKCRERRLSESLCGVRGAYTEEKGRGEQGGG